MRYQSILKLALILILGLGIFSSCTKNNASEPSNSLMSEASRAAARRLTADGPAIATVRTTDYDLKIHEAISFLPEPDGKSLFQLNDGYKFVVLDISVNNKTAHNLDMGEIILSAEITDDQGENHFALSSAGPVAAYCAQNHDPLHQQEFDAIWNNKFGAGAFHRTTAIGMRVRKEVKTFTMKMPSNPEKEDEVVIANFSL